jgi:hypothetical protein
MSEAIHAAFAKAGGQAQYELLAPWGKDGHQMFFGNAGSKIWSPVLDAYLKSNVP